MGLLTEGTPLTWEETVKNVELIKKHGINQFLNIFNKNKERQDDGSTWGDEIEYTIIKMDDNNRKATVCCNAEQLLASLQVDEETNKITGRPNPYLWRPEFASYMIEGTPGVPYKGEIPCIETTAANMKARREAVGGLLKDNEMALSISFPSLGTANFTSPEMKPNEDAGASPLWPAEATYGGHPRFANLSKNIKSRRESSVQIHVPMYEDTNTVAAMDPNSCGDSISNSMCISMDHMGFGMGLCCLQVTMQAENLDKARKLYDILTPLTPVLLALSASTPIFRGKLSTMDCRWNVISASVDDRTPEERGVEPLKTSKFVLKKSRYGTTSSYLHPSSVAFNDVPLQHDKKLLAILTGGGVDEQLAMHVAHLFIRDPLQVFRERIEQDDEKDTEHFESIQSSNWNNMRFKPPPIDAPSIGWRVEFRPMEVQLTDFENAAYSCFVVLVARMLLFSPINLLVPISAVDENMKRAQNKDAVLNQKLLFRKQSADGYATPNSEMEELTVNEIVNGQKEGFPGLIPLIEKFLDETGVQGNLRSSTQNYLSFISKRATGECQTLAKWMRDFVLSHPEYKQDSDVNQEIVYDLIKKMDDVTNGRMHCEKLLGNNVIQADKNHEDLVVLE